jgi:hypothetical protein
MITEAEIDKILAALEAETLENNFATEENEYWNYLNSESFRGLSEEEHQLLFFVNSVIYLVVQAHPQYTLPYDIEALQEAEEACWALREELGNWEKTKDELFKDYEQEDLLAFVEDLLAEDEEESLSDIGKEVIFITSKCYMDLIERA